MQLKILINENVYWLISISFAFIRQNHCKVKQKIW